MIWIAACVVGFVLLFAMYFFHPHAFAESMRHAAFWGATWRGFTVLGVYKQVAVQIGRACPALALALPVALVTYAAWPRTRYFGNTAPLLVAVLFLVLGMAHPHVAGRGISAGGGALPVHLCLWSAGGFAGNNLPASGGGLHCHVASRLRGQDFARLGPRAARVSCTFDLESGRPELADRENMIMTFTAAFWIALGALLLPSPAAAAQKPIPVLLVDGQSGGPYHAWQLTTSVLKKALEETGRFEVTVATSPQFGGDFSDFKPKFGDYKAIVWNYDAPDWPADQRLQLEEYVRNGGGLVVVHAADNAFAEWPAWNQMIGIGGWRNRSEKSGPLWYFKDGKLVSDTSPGPAGSHGARIPFQVVTREPEHPIMKGLPSAWMHAADELYATLRGPGEHMTVLATAHSDPENKGTDRDEPMLMVLSYGKGRIFHTTMGHDVAALSCVGFMTTYQRGTEWAATGKVTQNVPATFPTADTVSFRVDIARMDPAFLANAPTAAPPQPARPLPAQQRP